MRLDRSRVVLRPRTVGELLDLGCRLCCRDALSLVLRVALVLLLPCWGACLALRYVLEWSWVSVWCAAVALGCVVQGGFTVLAGRWLFAESLTAREVLGHFFRRLASYSASLVSSRVYLAVACLPLFVTLPFAWTQMLFVHEASLLENAPPIEACRRSARFVRPRFSTDLALLATLLCAHAGGIVVAELLGDAIVDGVLQLGKPFGSLFSAGGSPFALLGFFGTIPFIATARFLGYVDGRTRGDGWDIQVQFMAIAAAAEEREPETPASERAGERRRRRHVA